jgi:PBP1b-binding outer membrane lipoprotein LpoB
MKNLRTKLSYTLYILLVAFLFCGCNNTHSDKKTNYTYQEGEFTIVEIDSCEYILSDVYSGNSICHKGNCKFCIERSKK